MGQENPLGLQPPQKRLSFGRDRLVEIDKGGRDTAAVVATEEIRIRRLQGGIPRKEKALVPGADQVGAVWNIPEQRSVMDGIPRQDIGIFDAEPCRARADRPKHPGGQVQPRPTDEEIPPRPHCLSQFPLEMIRMKMGKQEPIQMGKAAGAAPGGVLLGQRQVGKAHGVPLVDSVCQQAQGAVPEIESGIGRVKNFCVHALSRHFQNRITPSPLPAEPLTAGGWRGRSPDPGC